LSSVACAPVEKNGCARLRKNDCQCDQWQSECEDKHGGDAERDRPAGASELDARGPIALAGDGGKRFRVPRSAAIEEYGDHADREQGQSERASDPEGRRRRDDGALDVGGEHVDARRPPDEARYLVRGHAHHEQEQQRRKDRGPQQR